MLRGLMMNRPLLIADIMDYAAEIHPKGELISANIEGGIHRTTYAETAKRIARLAHALRGLGIGPGDRVATLAWNSYRHFDLYYAISGIGAVCHTINPRLSAEQLIYITHHADDKILFLDTVFLPLIEKLRDKLPQGMRYVAMTDQAHMPRDSALDLLCYEDLLAGQPDSIDWPEFPEETAAGLCYTSGTTGNPKGALYSHRSTVLHAMTVALAMQDGLRSGQRVLPVVPLFHVNAWGLPYAAPLTGVSLVFPGQALDGKSLFDLMDGEGVYSAWGVPTVWLWLLAEMKARGKKPSGLSEVVVGGSAAPRSMIEAFEAQWGISVSHAWGMTEMSPVGTQGVLPAHLRDLSEQERIDLKCKQGRRVFGVDLKIVDADGKHLPHDGTAAGELYVRGNTVVSGYFNDEEATAQAIDEEGWFGTSDIASIDADGTLTITDRTKDLIKSGGEWISSLDLENAAMSHPGVANCAAIAVPHPKWGERPLLVVINAEGANPAKEELLEHLSRSVAKWQVPDDVVFVDELPLTATGKVSKRTLRETYAEYKPAAAD